MSAVVALCMAATMIAPVWATDARAAAPATRIEFTAQGSGEQQNVWTSSEYSGDKAVNAFDKDPNSKWHADWATGHPAAASKMPQFIAWQFNNSVEIDQLVYKGRNDAGNCRWQQFRVYVMDQAFANAGAKLTTTNENKYSYAPLADTENPWKLVYSNTQSDKGTANETTVGVVNDAWTWNGTNADTTRTIQFPVQTAQSILVEITDASGDNSGKWACAAEIESYKRRTTPIDESVTLTDVKDVEGPLKENGNIDKTVVTAEAVAGGHQGTSASYDGAFQSLTSAMYTFTKKGEKYAVQSQTANGTPVWLTIRNSPKGTETGYPFATSEQLVNVTLRGDQGNQFTFEDNKDAKHGALYFHRNDQVRFDAVDQWTDLGGKSTLFELYRLPVDDERTSTEVSGFVRATEIKDGEKYLIVAKADNGSRYALRPSDDQNNRYDHVLKITNDAIRLTPVGVGAATVQAEYINYNVVVDALQKGTSLTLGGNIGVNFHVNLSDKVVQDSNAKVVITAPNADGSTDVTEEIPQSKFAAAKQKDGTYKFTASVTARQMTKNITFKVVKGNQELVSQTTTVRKVADGYLSGNYTEKTKTLVKTMLTYGGKMQTYKGETANLADDGITDVDLNSAVEGIKAYKSAKKNDTGVTVRPSLQLRDTTAVGFYFPASEVSDWDFKNGEQALETSRKDDYTYVEIGGINPQNLNKNVILTVDNHGTVTYSPMDYALEMVDNADKNLGNVVKAMYLYNQAAIDYQNAPAQ